MGHSKYNLWDMAMLRINQVMKTVLISAVTFLVPMAANAVDVQSIEYSMLSAENAQIKLTLSGPAPTPKSFTIENPARLAIDLPDTGLSVEKDSIFVDSDVVRNIRAVEAGGRTRIVVNMVQVVPYEIRTQNNQVFINLKSAGQRVSKGGTSVSGAAKITNLDFSRSVDGGAAIKVKLSDANASVSINKKSNKVVVDFYDYQLPEKLSRRLDVTDFATPVKFVDFYNTAPGARLAISAVGEYEHLAYQTGDEYTVEIKPLSKQEAEAAKKDEFGYSGEKLSLNFQNIEVRAVLQLIADFTGLNIVASDTVQGNITLRLKNVPWDQALDIILKTRGLGMRKSGNVVLIAPNKELAAREQAELEAQKQITDLAPLYTEFYNVNYAKADDIAKLLKSSENSILSDRGSVTIDKRTNTLMVLDTAEKHQDIASLIKKLDVPVKQVMIESRIVIANDDFSRDLGVRFGVSGSSYRPGENQLVSVTGSGTGADQLAINRAAAGTLYNDPGGFNTQASRYNVNFPAGGGAPSIATTILKDNFLVDLELSALQTEGRGEVISNPRVVTSNQKEASIEQGVQIPYQEASSSGATSVSFKDAVLSLKVTPQVTPDDRVHMALEVNKDSVGGIYAGVPSINTRSVNTEVLVNDGATVVLGGIYETSSAVGESKVPLLGDIPLLGYLFRSKSNSQNKAELLIFVTPKILKEGLTSAAVE